MGCLFVVLAMLAPRLTMVFLWLCTGWFARAFGAALPAVLGFVFLPYTTLAYVAAVNHGGLGGGWLVLLGAALLVDLGVWGGGRKARKARGR